MDVVKQLYKSVFGQLGGAFGDMGKPFAEQGAKYGVESLEFNPKDYFDSESIFSLGEFFDTRRAFDPDKLANDYLTNAIGLK